MEQVINGKTVRFELHKNYAGEVGLRATHVDGTEVAAGHLLVIRSDGRFERHEYVSEKLGLKLNGEGQIKQVK